MDLIQQKDLFIIKKQYIVQLLTKTIPKYTKSFISTLKINYNKKKYCGVLP